MPTFIRSIARPKPFAGALAIVALMGTTMLASSPNAAWAGSGVPGSFQVAQTTAPANPAAAGATEAKMETVEQRITNLHTALKITSDQEGKWKAVAQAMRENAAAMDKLVVATQKTAPQAMSALEDLKMYQKFAQAHVDGLKNLIDDFQALYDAMPAAQRKNADQVFQTSEAEAVTLNR